jgi:predicted nucleic acid-binding protein
VKGTRDGARNLTFDTGALVALDRGDRRQWARLREAQQKGIVPVIPSPVITQAWRSSRQANLGRALKLCAVEPVDEQLAKEAGQLCGTTRTRDAVDAIVVASAARRGSMIVTSDHTDLARLAACTKGVTLGRV